MAETPDPQQPAQPSRDGGSFADDAEKITPDMVGPKMIGRVVNRLYKVERVLGQGGMGCVMEVLHLRLLRREAMKVPMKEFMADAEYMQRFRREALTMARFEHPNIVQVYDVHIADSHDSDISYITMEFVEGLPIDAYAYKNQNSLTVGDLMQILMKLARALDKAHEKKVIHRDIKPANIFIRTTDIEPKLMDFGVARAEIASAYKTSYTTGGNNSSFTAAYAAPEQIMGQQVTNAADIYAFAVTIYKLLCRSFPFKADNAAAFIVAHVQLPPIPVRDRNPRWPDGVDRALMKAMSKDPALRQRFAVDLVRDLNSALQGFEAVPMAKMFDPNAVLPQPVTNQPTATDHAVHVQQPLAAASSVPAEKSSATKSILIFVAVILLVAMVSYFVMDGKGAAFRQPKMYFPELKSRAARTLNGDGRALWPVWETPTPSPSPSPSATPTATGTPSPSPSLTPSPTHSPAPPSPSLAPVVIPPTATRTPSATPSLTPKPSPSESPTPSPSPEPTPSAVPTPREVTARFAVSPDVDAVAIIMIEGDTIDVDRLLKLYPRRSRSFLESHAAMLNAKPANALTPSAASPLVLGAAQFPYDRVQWIVESPTQALLLAGKYMEWYEASVKGTPRETTAAKLREQITFSVSADLTESTAMPNRSLSIPGCWSVDDGTWKWEADRYSRVDARGRSDQRLERIPLTCFNTP
ncbi:serine/threonine protein kinase [Candidatus Sumerlaeota bacterium]|nr:serine/threonine protein kinase [Candidatus Sumerlaeota bacterium]